MVAGSLPGVDDGSLRPRAGVRIRELGRELALPPAVALGFLIEHSAADSYAGRAAADVSPVADGGRAGAEPLGHLLGGQQPHRHDSSSRSAGRSDWHPPLEKAPKDAEW